MIFARTFILLLFVLSISGDVCPKESQSPVVLVHGIMGSVLEGLLDIPSSVPLPHSFCTRKSENFKVVWVSGKEMIPEKIDCLVRYMSLEFNSTTGESKNLPGVSVRVPDFGSVYAVDRLDPDDIFSAATGYFHKAIETLRASGFDEGRTIFAAPYDWRLFPTKKWIDDTRELVEKAYKLSGNNKITFVSHSMGCPYSYVFFMSQPLSWRSKYIREWVALSGPMIGAPLVTYLMLAKATIGLPYPFSDMGLASKHIEGGYFLTPNKFFGSNTIISTPSKKYTWENLHQVLEKDKLPFAKVVIDKSRKFLDQFGFEHPGINITFIWSTGVKTISGMRYSLDSEVGVTAPLPEFEDGDGAVTSRSLAFLHDFWTSNKTATKVMKEELYTKKIVVNRTTTNHLSILGSKEFLDHLKQTSCIAN